MGQCLKSVVLLKLELGAVGRSTFLDSVSFRTRRRASPANDYAGLVTGEGPPRMWRRYKSLFFTEVGIISLGGLSYSTSARVAGDKMDEAISGHVRRSMMLRS